MIQAKFGRGQCYYAQANTINPTLEACSPNSKNSNHAQLGFMALGESPTPGSGGWRGAGTNGGTQAAFIHMSWGAPTFMPYTELGSAFAGLQLLGDVMITNGDINGADSGWGGAIAAGYNSNELGKVADQYVSVIASTNSGGGCDGSGSVHGGINGCGCYVAMTVTTAPTYGLSPMSSNWASLVEPAVYQTGGNNWYYEAECNYNLSQYPFSGGDH
jgi:hypothetical protein